MQNPYFGFHVDVGHFGFLLSPKTAAATTRTGLASQREERAALSAASLATSMPTNANLNTVIPLSTTTSAVYLPPPSLVGCCVGRCQLLTMTTMKCRTHVAAFILEVDQAPSTTTGPDGEGDSLGLGSTFLNGAGGGDALASKKTPMEGNLLAVQPPKSRRSSEAPSLRSVRSPSTSALPSRSTNGKYGASLPAGGDGGTPTTRGSQ